MAEVTIQQAFELALQHHQAGRLQQAEQLYRQILAAQPEHAGALHYLGVIAHQVGQNEMAVDLIHRALALMPSYSEAWNNLGEALRAQGRVDEAITAYRRALALNPNYPQACYNLGNALNAKGELDDAIAAYRQGLALAPGDPAAWNNLGNALQAKGQLDEAIAAYQQALALKSDYPEAQNNLGGAWQAKGQFDQAVAAWRQAIALRPGSSEPHYNMGNALKDQGRVDEAIAAYRQALALKPGFPEAHCQLGNALRDKEFLDEALAAYRAALTLRPDFAEAHSNLILCLNYHPGFDAPAIAQEQRRWNQQHAPLKKYIQPHANDRKADRRLRIGYVSADFRAHASANFLAPLLANHDRGLFEVFAFAEVPAPDARTQQLRGYTDHWRSTVGLSDRQVADVIRTDGIDILVDLKLHAPNNRLLVFAHKPAPVQVSWLGYPGSTGLWTIDYRLSDPYLDPPDARGIEEPICSEQTIRLSDTFWCYDPLDERDIPVKALPALQSGVVTFGCLNNFCKINEGILALWAEVLRKVNNSRLLLLAPEGDHRQRTLERLHREGIDPERVEFALRQSRPGYLELYHRIDLGLDSFPYNGHTTSLDSFWMGVPVVTLVGQRAVSRAGWSQLSNMGLRELAGQTPEQFVQIAADLANDLPRLQELRRTLRQRMQASPLMDASKFARGIEAAYRQMWQKWCAPVPGDKAG